MTYSQTWDHMQNKVSETTILRDEDGAFIPTDPDNIDYQAYLTWLDEGNQPTPYTPPNTTTTDEGEDNGPTPKARHTAEPEPSARHEHSRSAEPPARSGQARAEPTPAREREHSRQAPGVEHGPTGRHPKGSGR